MEIRKISINQLRPNTGQIDGLPANPRTWTQTELNRLAESIQETPSLLEARGCIVWKEADGEFIVLGGNMRLEACRSIGMTSIPCIVLPENLTKDKLAEIVLKDNGSFGNWDYDLLEEGWDADEVETWGVERWRETAPAADLSGLPDELQGLDIAPDDLENIVGDDETARSRVIITFREEDRWRLEEVFGIRDITSRVIWMLEDIVKQRQTEE